jgi:ribonuclease HI
VRGGGGVLYELGGKRILNYCWNLGKDTNNKAEAYALLKGLQLANQRQIHSLNVVGDSKTIIRMIVLVLLTRNSFRECMLYCEVTK